MAEAIIYINGVIGGDVFSQEADDQGTTLQDVRAQFESFKNPDSVTVYINSIGGSVSEGLAIHDYFRSLGIPVQTIGSTVYSIATTVLMAGDEGKRFLRPNARFLVHNPMPSFGIQSDAEGYRQLADILEKEQNELINFYSQKTGITADFVKSEMRKDRTITAKEALQLGFISGIKEIDNIKKDISKQPIQAKYIPGGDFSHLRETLINKYSEMENDNKKVLSSFAASLKAILNLGGGDKEEEKVIETKEQTPAGPTIEERFAAMEAKLADLSAQKEQSDLNTKNAIELVNKQKEEIALKNQEIIKTIAAIEELEKQPVIVNSGKTAPIADQAKNDSPWNFFVDQGVLSFYSPKLNQYK